MQLAASEVLREEHRADLGVLIKFGEQGLLDLLYELTGPSYAFPSDALKEFTTKGFGELYVEPFTSQDFEFIAEFNGKYGDGYITWFHDVSVHWLPPRLAEARYLSEGWQERDRLDRKFDKHFSERKRDCSPHFRSLCEAYFGDCLTNKGERYALLSDAEAAGVI
jgi:hypothetical protein